MPLDPVPQILGYCGVFFVQRPLNFNCKTVDGHFYILQTILSRTTLIIFELIDVHFRNE